MLKVEMGSLDVTQENDLDRGISMYVRPKDRLSFSTWDGDGTGSTNVILIEDLFRVLSDYVTFERFAAANEAATRREVTIDKQKEQIAKMQEELKTVKETYRDLLKTIKIVGEQ